MKFTLALVTVVIAQLVAIITAQGAEVQSVNIITYGKGQLAENATNDFLSCLDGTGTAYRIYVPTDGTVTVIPPGGREIDRQGTDVALLQCFMAAARSISVVAETTDYSDENHDHALGLHDMTYEWLQSQGAAD